MSSELRTFPDIIAMKLKRVADMKTQHLRESVHCISGYKICAAVRFPSSRPMMVQHLTQTQSGDMFKFFLQGSSLLAVRHLAWQRQYLKSRTAIACHNVSTVQEGLLTRTRDVTRLMSNIFVQYLRVYFVNCDLMNKGF